MHDVVTESQHTTELCDVYLVGSELCGVCCVLWCVGSGFQDQGLGSGNLDPMRATEYKIKIVLYFSINDRTDKRHNNSNTIC
jgi:hypothetical protein